MKHLLTFFLLFGALTFGASGYQCELKARTDIMDPMVSIKKSFDGKKGIEIKAKSYTMKFSSVPINDRETLALWLGVDDAHSAVTLA